MRRHLLLAGVAGLALTLIPAAVQAQEYGGDPINGYSELENDYRNSIQAAVSTQVESLREVALSTGRPHGGTGRERPSHGSMRDGVLPDTVPHPW